jgi:TctA family transporter
MKDFFLTKILQYLSRRFDGYKTYAGAAGKALAGLGTLISGIIGLIGIAFPDQGLPQMDIQSALGLIGAGAFAISSGLSSYGVGKKLDKAADQRIDIAAIAQTDTTRAGGLAPR